MAKSIFGSIRAQCQAPHCWTSQQWHPVTTGRWFARLILLLTLLLLLAALRRPAEAADPLPSWNEGPAKTAIVQFVERVTREGSPDFVPPELRIATFDNDGTLWCE